MYTVSSPPMHSNENDTIASNDLQWRKNYRIYVCVCVYVRVLMPHIIVDWLNVPNFLNAFYLIR